MKKLKGLVPRVKRLIYGSIASNQIQMLWIFGADGFVYGTSGIPLSLPQLRALQASGRKAIRLAYTTKSQDDALFIDFPIEALLSEASP